jgi:hypothetical protein
VPRARLQLGECADGLVVGATLMLAPAFSAGLQSPRAALPRQRGCMQQRAAAEPRAALKPRKGAQEAAKARA